MTVQGQGGRSKGTANICRLLPLRQLPRWSNVCHSVALGPLPAVLQTDRTCSSCREMEREWRRMDESAGTVNDCQPRMLFWTHRVEDFRGFAVPIDSEALRLAVGGGKAEARAWVAEAVYEVVSVDDW